MTARLRVEQAGPLVTIQDAGRPGWRRYGVPPSGPVDRLAFAAAHTALGNPPDAAALELSHGGLALVCEEGSVGIALTGAGFAATLDGLDVGAWALTTLTPGARLNVKANGNWGYLAFAGTLRAQAWLGSRATHLLAGLGGARVAARDVLTIDDPRPGPGPGSVALPPPDLTPIAAARIVLGPQDRFFAPDTLATLTGGPFAATARFDRMGLVLDGPTLPATRIDMPSEPAIRGAVQVDGDGRATVLLADHQTTGGYPRIATIVDADTDRVARLRDGAALRFHAIAVEEAIDIARAAAAARTTYLNAIPRSIAARPSLLSANLIGGVVDALQP